MLKIKDNVDLKELEKYGIRKGFEFMRLDIKESEKDREVLSIDTKRIISVGKELWWSMDYYYGFVKKYITNVTGDNSNIRGGEDILYDLIQAGLVEKV